MQQTWFKRSTRLLDDPRIFRLYIEFEKAGSLVPLLWEEVLAFNTDAGKDGILEFDDMFVLFIGRRLVALGEDPDVLEKIIEGFIREDLVRQLPDDRFLITGWESWKPNKSEAERKAEYRAMKERRRTDSAPSGPGAASSPPPSPEAMSGTCPGHLLSDSTLLSEEEEVQEEEPAFDANWWRAALTKQGITPTKAILKSVRLSRLTPEEFSILADGITGDGLLVWTLKEGRPGVNAALRRVERAREKAAAPSGEWRVVDGVEETNRQRAERDRIYAEKLAKQKDGAS